MGALCVSTGQMPRLQTIGGRVPTVKSRLLPPAKLTDPFYTSREWRDLAAMVKAQRGYVCENPECRADMSGNRRALIADHVHERRDGGADLDPLNVQLLCLPCHTRKTAQAKAARPDNWR